MAFRAMFFAVFVFEIKNLPFHTSFFLFLAVLSFVISSANPENMAPARKAMKAMKAKAGLTATGAFAAVAESAELKPKQVKTIITSYIELAATELKKNGAFKLAGVLNMKLKKKPARLARKGINPFTKEPFVFKAKLASRTAKCFPMKKLKEAWS